MGRTRMGGRFDPEKYGMIFCPDCSGSGKSFMDPKGDHVCKVCGGFGLIIKRQEKAVVFDRRFPTIFQAESPIDK